MALTKTITFGKTGTRPYGELTITETATSVSANTSTLNVKLVLKRPSAVSSSANKTASVTVNGTNWTWNGSIGGSGDKTLINKTLTVKHNTDGSKSINLAASIQLDITWSGTKLGTISGSGTMTLTKIQQYSSITQSLSSRTETTAVIRYVCDLPIDYLWFSINNGSTWTGLNVADGTSGTYTISGLAANTNYKIKTRVRNKASQLTTDSSALSVTTYNWPYATVMPDFTIGEKVTIKFYNPLGRTFTFYVVANGTTIANNWTVTGTSYSGINATSSINQLYATIPNAKSATYQIRCICNGNAIVKTGGKFSIDSAVCKPSIAGASYADVNSDTVAITGNDQNIIQNRSKVRYTATGLAAQKSATVASVAVKVNGQSYNLGISGNTATGGNAVINSGNDVEAVLTVTDSRGLTASKTITVSMLALSQPTAVITLARQDNYYSATDILVDAHYSSVDGKNTISIAYSCTKDGDSAATVTGTLTDNVQSTITLDNSFGWAVKVTLTDRFGMATSYNLYVSRGMPIIFFDRGKSSVGVNCFPKDESSLEVNGYNVGRNVITRALGANVTNLTASTYTIVPLDLTNVFGDKLTPTNDGGVLVGANVSKVLVSGRASIQGSSTAGRRHLRIMKNSYTNNNTLAWSQDDLAASVTEDIVITPTLADVKEGDIIYLWYHVPNSADTLGGNAYGARTSLTVETIG